ncbi:hypothetical protein NEUTE1DRAFT_116578 [Neurospora tetrasperma FGSC 2508]|uniref:Uncharacterized protein n=1 Tax=Neurospora tetrasperma (strain FGSC 2508 / ATCC MYA-4615 / P0657) TaxID=510951 RepID=F8MHF0_NEUT8|nr:uncharacterized protein NEUTE1DRAFT_116578 [Neurospora tetrasperma FGSC 2508]EGO59613.1 hypothetical protein NEUTE1DRAFT_116578 [Neurospora tetrasperma FGSC 2508]EGZ73741.1 hypothetical protein NEUTE2DRAFT_144270 [Neurospora tetrasperma FGSC 2509]
MVHSTRKKERSTYVGILFAAKTRYTGYLRYLSWLNIECTENANRLASLVDQTGPR